MLERTIKPTDGDKVPWEFSGGRFLSTQSSWQRHLTGGAVCHRSRQVSTGRWADVSRDGDDDAVIRFFIKALPKYVLGNSYILGPASIVLKKAKLRTLGVCVLRRSGREEVPVC